MIVLHFPSLFSAYANVAKVATMASKASCFKAGRKIIIIFMKKILITRRSTHDPFKISTRSVGPKNPTEENAELASTKKTLIDPVC